MRGRGPLPPAPIREPAAGPPRAGTDHSLLAVAAAPTVGSLEAALRANVHVPLQGRPGQADAVREAREAPPLMATEQGPLAPGGGADGEGWPARPPGPQEVAAGGEKHHPEVPALPADLTAIDRDVVGEIWTSRQAMNVLEALCDFGSRWGGSESERRAVEFMAATFEAYGVDRVAREPFRHLGWTRGTAGLELLSPAARTYDCISLPHVATGRCEGELIYVGFGTPDEFAAARDQIPGKVVMVNTKSPAYFHRPIHRKEKLGRALEAGAVGVIFMRYEPGLLPETGSTRHDRPLEAPAVSVSREVGEELRRLGRDGPVRVRIRVENTFDPQATSWNVVGEFRGRTDPDTMVVVEAHFDGHDIAAGALDDGAGAAVVMEAARALARHKDALGCTVRFVCFALEEVGLQGSFNYVAGHRDELDRVRFMLNLDGAGSGWARDLAVQGWPELIPYFRGLLSRLNEPGLVDNHVVLFTDCFPFLAAGVPSATVANLDERSGVRGYGHTRADTLDKVNLRDLQLDAIKTARLVLRLANADDWPARRKTEAEVKRVIGDVGLEVLRLAGRYPFND